MFQQRTPDQRGFQIAAVADVWQLLHKTYGNYTLKVTLAKVGKKEYYYFTVRAVNSGVECHLHTVEATGSNPVPRNMIYEYKKSFNTPYTSIDRSGKLGLVESMDLNQDMITEFYGSIGSDNKILRQNDNAAWIYTRTKMVIKELPFWNTKTEAKSYISALSPIRMSAEVQLNDESGKLLFAAKTEMCAIDFVERKIRKVDTLTFPKDLEASPTLIEEGFGKLAADFTEDDFVLEEKVYASDTDFTHHTNNTHYVKFLMNTFDTDFYDTKSITDFEIQFAKESAENDILRIYKKATAENEFAFQIKRGDEVIVKAFMRYSNQAQNWMNM